MSRSAYVRFDGLIAPVLLDGCKDLLAPMRRIIPGWSFEVTPEPGDVEPAVIVSPAGGGRFASMSLSSRGKVQTYDAVNTICDMIVELSWELLRSGQQLMCLHGAAIELSGRLVILPNVRRAGKSTLTACLAQRNCRVFSDDFFPIGLDADGCFRGYATGISPRLRLPLPAEFSAGFRGWVARNDGPENRQYKYLTLPDLPRHGAAAPLGAIVILDRRDHGPTTISVVDESAALEALLHQNFARSVHSGTILHAVRALLASVPLRRLSYSSAEDAAAFLQDAFADWQDTLPIVGDAHLMRVREVDEARLLSVAPEFAPGRAYVRSAGYSEAAMNGAHYVTDACGLGIHRLNEGSLAIWRLLEEPMRLDELCDVLGAAFPDVPRARIERDSARILRRFVESWLVEVAGDPG